MVCGAAPRGLCFVTRGYHVELWCIYLFFVGVVVVVGVVHDLLVVILMMSTQMYVCGISPDGESDGVCCGACLRDVVTGKQ